MISKHEKGSLAETMQRLWDLSQRELENNDILLTAIMEIVVIASEKSDCRWEIIEKASAAIRKVGI